MSKHLLSRDLIEKLGLVDSKLQQLLTPQTLPQDEGLPETQPSPDKKILPDILVADSEDEKTHTAASFSEGSKNPLPFRVAVSPREPDSIFQKVDKINQYVEVMLRVENFERQNRKIVILGSMVITLVILMIGVSAFLMHQTTLLNQDTFLKNWHRISQSQPSSGEGAAKVNGPQLPAPIIAAHDPGAAEPVLKVSDPQPVTTPADPKPVEVAPPVKYVGYMTSNKYHYPGCKWATGINRYKHQTFSSVKEAREKGYNPCPTCHPPESD